MFSSSKPSEGLDQPLLGSSTDADTERPPVAMATHVTLVGQPTRPGYNRIMPGEDDDDNHDGTSEAAKAAKAEAAAARANQVAMRRQQEHAQNFEREMLSEEQRIVREAKDKAAREDEDARLARQLQSEFERESGQAAALNTTTMMVVVPQGARGGQPLGVDMPGRGTVQIMVPAGLKPGDSFQFKVPNTALRGTPQAQEVRVRVPQGGRPGSTFPVQLPSGKVVMVAVPPGVLPGDELRVPWDANTGASMPAAAQQRAQSSRGQQRAAGAAPGAADEDEALAIMESIMEVKETAEERAEREAFLAALPEDVRREVLAQETAQKRSLAKFKDGPPPPRFTAEQQALLDSLPAELRAEVERDMMAENASRPVASAPPAQTTTTTPARPPAPSRTNPPPSAPPPPPPQASAADMLDASSSLYPSVPVATAVDDSASLFSNLSVRGVGSAGKKDNKSQQI